MTARAQVEPDFPTDHVKILLGVTNGDGIGYVLRFGDIEMVDHRPDVMHEPGTELRIDGDLARALYEALARYFGGAPDVVTVRADLAHERDRVDRLIGFLEPGRT
jgi:hypothetical protein